MKLVFVTADHSPMVLGQGIHRIGSSDEADIVLSGEGIRSQHAELYVGPHGVSLRPAAEARVAVNGHAADGLIAVRAGDVFSVGEVKMRLEAMSSTVAAPTAEDETVPGTAPPESAPAPQTPVDNDTDVLAVTRVQPALPKFVLRGVSSVGFGRTFPLLGATVVGRANDCDIHLDHPGLSRRQARLTPTKEGLLVEDLGSTNGTLLNEKKIDRSVARHGDELGFDVMRFRIVSTQHEETGAVQSPATQAAPVSEATATPSRTWVWLAAGAAVIVLLVLVGVLR